MTNIDPAEWVEHDGGFSHTTALQCGLCSGYPHKGCVSQTDHAVAVKAAEAEGFKRGAGAVREAVRAVHRSQPDRADGYQHLYCMGCWSRWPCQTARALAATEDQP